MQQTSRILAGTWCVAVATLVVGCTPGSAGPRHAEPTEWVLADSSASRPTIAVDATGGTFYVAYTSKAGGETNVFVARAARNAGVFDDPVRVNDVAGDAAAHNQAPAQVAVGLDGTVYVAWLTQTAVPGRRFPASDIRLARSSDGGHSFEPAITVNDDPGFPTGHHFHNMAVGPDGTVYVSWLDGSTRDAAAALASGSSSVPVVRAAHDGGHGGHGGHDHRPDDLPGIEVRVARSIDGGRSFEPAVTVAEGSCQCCRTALAISSAGTIYVAWRHILDGSIRDISVARSEDGGRTFSAPMRVHADEWRIDGCPHTGPALAVDGEGALHVAWYTGADGSAGVYYAASRDDGITFGTPSALVTEVPVAQVAAATGGRKGARIAWEDPLRDRVGMARFADSNAEPSSTEILSGSVPSMAPHSEGSVIAWKGGSAVHVRIFPHD